MEIDAVPPERQLPQQQPPSSQLSLLLTLPRLVQPPSYQVLPLPHQAPAHAPAPTPATAPAPAPAPDPAPSGLVPRALGSVAAVLSRRVQQQSRERKSGVQQRQIRRNNGSLDLVHTVRANNVVLGYVNCHDHRSNNISTMSHKF